jgi:short-subunit dehydrogenase
VIDVNLWGVIHGIRAFVPTLVAQNEGHVVNTASLAGVMGVPFLASYAAAKNGVVGISESLHHELTLVGSSVGVTVVCPSFVATRISDSDRNWPEKLGPVPESASNPVTQAIEDVFRQRIAEGVPPGVLADQVVAAVRAKRFFVTTDEETAAFAMRSRAGFLEGASPELPPFE